MSLLRNLATSLINAQEDRIVTTLPKAKELRPFVERAITLSRNAANLEGDSTEAKAVHLRRQAASYFHSGNSQQKVSAGRRGQERAPRTAGVQALRRLFDELGERYKDRAGGYTRIIKLGHRDGDNAELAIIELVDNRREREAAESASKRTKTATSGKKKAKAGKGSDEEGGRRRRLFKRSQPAATDDTEKSSAEKPKGGRRAKNAPGADADKDTEE